MLRFCSGSWFIKYGEHVVLLGRKTRKLEKDIF